MSQGLQAAVGEGNGEPTPTRRESAGDLLNDENLTMFET